ncbi:hypothetical protein C8J56DRAFT_1057639 [Mycena floridula]|nr:hypothetical protein C8J56DRAFT_1057639 [Mycena floridula]
MTFQQNATSSRGAATNSLDSNLTRLLMLDQIEKVGQNTAFALKRLLIIDDAPGIIDHSADCDDIQRASGAKAPNGKYELPVCRIQLCLINICSTHANIFRDRYGKKADSASRATHKIMTLDTMAGADQIPPVFAGQLYIACVDPHLISGCDVIINIDDPGLEALETVQKASTKSST